MNLKLTLSGLDELERRLQNIVDAGEQVGQDADQLEAETFGHAYMGAQANVYATEPGAYQRTMDLLDGIQVRVTGRKGMIAAQVWNTTDYAGDVEVGEEGMTPEEIASDALSRSASEMTEPMTYGRSGVDYRIAGPIIIPATVYAAYRARELFLKRARAR